MKHGMYEVLSDLETLKRSKTEEDDGFTTITYKKRADLKLMKEHLKDPIRLNFIKELILWIFADGMNQKWAFVKNRLSIPKICLLITQGNSSIPNSMTFNDDACISAKEEDAFFDFGVRTVCGIERHGIIPLSETLLKCQPSKSASRNLSTASSNKLSFENLVLDSFLLTENNFNISMPNGFVASAMAAVTYDVLAVDCEMVLTTEGQALARISIVDKDLRTVYDKLVKPSDPVTDYLTEFSGITKESLDLATATLQQVQTDILAIIQTETILIGHSLENDLCCLKIFHQRIIDTSVLYKHPEYPTYKHSLKYIAKKYLQKDIQFGAHDSVEDAKTCMELVLLKIEKGIDFAVNHPKELLTERLEKHQKKSIVTNDQQLFLASVPNYDFLVLDSLCHSETEHFDSFCRNDLFPLLPKYSLIMLVNGNKSLDRVNEFFARKVAAFKNKDSSWTQGDECTLQTLCNEVRQGFCLFKIVP